jgi:hypothetical protein
MTSNLLNGKQLTTAALKQDDQGAFKALLGTMLKPGIDPNNFRYDSVTTLSGKETSIEVRVAKEKSKVRMWVYRDPIELKYNRITLADLVSRHGNDVYVDFPAQFPDVFSSYLTSRSFWDRGFDVNLGTVTQPGDIVLTAVPSSLLLNGSATFNVKQLPKYLSDVVKFTTIDLFYPEVGMNGDPAALLINEINNLNSDDLPRPMVNGEVGFGVPEITSEYDGVNTRVALKNTGSEVYLGEVFIEYHRVNFSWLYNGTQLLMTGPNKPTSQDVLNKVVAMTGFTMTIDDIVVQPYDTIPSGETSTITVFVNAASLRYVGEITIDYTAE